MHNTCPSFSEQLLKQERHDPTLKQRYEKEKRDMIEKKLTMVDKSAHIFGLALCLFFMIFFGCVAIYIPSEFPMWGRVIFILGALFGLVGAGLEICILKKGTLNALKDDWASAGLGWAFIVIVTTIILVNADKLSNPTQTLITCVIYEICAGLALLKAIIQRSETRTQEKLLDIQYRIAELSEKLERKENH